MLRTALDVTDSCILKAYILYAILWVSMGNSSLLLLRFNIWTSLRALAFKTLLVGLEPKAAVSQTRPVYGCLSRHVILLARKCTPQETKGCPPDLKTALVAGGPQTTDLPVSISPAHHLSGTHIQSHRHHSLTLNGELLQLGFVS